MRTASVLPLPSPRARAPRRLNAGVPTVDIVIPVLNEASTIRRSVQRLREHLEAETTFRGHIIIVDNGSTDETLKIAARLSAACDDVSVLQLSERGRGRALRAAWLRSTADVVAYMDVDLSTDLSALPALVALVAQGGADVAIGSRLAKGARVRRGPRREIISRCYNRLLQTVLRVGFHDAQCGFKAMRSEVARVLVPLVEDNAWFFDTELLVRAERGGFKVVELPVSWTDDPDSRVAILRTAWLDLCGVVRLRTGGVAGAGSRLARFAVVGAASTVMYAAMFVGLARVTTALVANAIALVLSTAFNTETNRRFTFRVTGTDRRLAAHVTGAASLLIALLMTTAALGALHAVNHRPVIAAEVAATLTATAMATVVRYLLLQRFAIPADDASGGSTLDADDPLLALSA